MPIPIHSTEKPSTSETREAPKDSQPSAQVSNSQSDMAQQRSKTEAELAADKLYEERIEEEYAKREGGA
jgi:hypothetical protein